MNQIDTQKAKKLKRYLEAERSADENIKLAIKLLKQHGYNDIEAKAIAEFTFGQKKINRGF